jgi:hypothetical protein
MDSFVVVPASGLGKHFSAISWICFSPYGFTTFIAKRGAIGHQLVTLKPTIFCSHCRRHIPQSVSHLSTWLKLCPNFVLAVLNREQFLDMAAHGLSSSK